VLGGAAGSLAGGDEGERRETRSVESFWLDRLVRKAGLPYPVPLAALSLIPFAVGLVTAAGTGDLSLFLSEPRWILMSLFGLLSGTAAIYAVRGFDSALCEARSLILLNDSDFGRLRGDLRRLITSNFYWLVVAGWMIFSFVHVLLLRQPTWWTRGALYHYPLLLDMCGLLTQSWNGCVLGGMFMFMVPLTLNLAYSRICRPGMFSDGVAAPAERKALSAFTRLITVNTLAAAVLSAVAIAIWAQIPSKYVVYLPLVGSAMMFLPAAIVPHWLFHQPLSRARQAKLEMVGQEIDRIGSEDAQPSIGDLVALHKLLREESRIEAVRTWLVDPVTIVELSLAASTHYLVSFVLGLLERRH
jgi:hypothetical protein